MKDFTEKCEACEGRGGYSAGGPCTDCYGQGEIPDHGAKLDAYDKREVLVEEVIKAIKTLDAAIEDERQGKLHVPEWSARIDVLQAARKLAEWKPT